MTRAKLEAGQLIGEYRVTRLIDRGGLGAVYEAEHRDSGQPVAIKVFTRSISQNPLFIERFPFESRAISLARHPNLVEVIAFGMRPDRSCYVIMELVEGQTLQSRIGRVGRLAEKEALRIARQIAQALAAAEDIPHWNLRPANVMLTDDGLGQERVKVLDFGLARLAGETSPADDSPGAAAYLAPEQRAGSPRLDGRADVYSLGVILHEMLSGFAPTLDPPEPLGAPVSEDVAALVWKMVDRDPAGRPPLREVVSRLAHFDGSAAQAAEDPSQRTSGLPSGPSGATLAWAAVVADRRKLDKQREGRDRSRTAASSRRTARLLFLVAAGGVLCALGGAGYHLRSRRLAARQDELRLRSAPPQGPQTQEGLGTAPSEVAPLARPDATAAPAPTPGPPKAKRRR